MNYLWIGGAFAILAGFWRSLKTLVQTFSGVFIETCEVAPWMRQPLCNYLLTNYKLSNNYIKYFNAQSSKDIGHVLFENFSIKNYIFWNGWFPILFFSGYELKTKEKENENTVKSDPPYIMYIRGTLNIYKFQMGLINLYNQTVEYNKNHMNSNRFSIVRVQKGKHDKIKTADLVPIFCSINKNVKLVSHSNEEVNHPKELMIDKLVFPQKINDVVKYVESWRNNSEWYKEKGIDWRSGLLLYGPPGTGKSRLAKSIAEKINLPLCVFDLSTFTNDSFIIDWEVCKKSYTPCVVLFEDFDNIFNGRENIVKMSEKEDSSQLNFSTFLNCIDGVDNADGIFTIITTNHIDKIDPALKNRPGRIDFTLELTYMEESDKILLARKIIGENTRGFEEFVAAGTIPNETGAMVEQRCKEIAIKELYKCYTL